MLYSSQTVPSLEAAHRVVKPNFFIVGAPKCATTALTKYLRQHPEVGIIGKEVHHFGSDLQFRRRLPSRQEYLAMARRLDRFPAVGDASVYYLYSEVAAGEIKAFCPEARIIIMLRNPVDVMYSLHSQLLRSVDEDIEDFEEALDAEFDRASGRRIPSSIHAVHALQYRAICSFASQVERYLRVFDRSNVLVWTYEDVLLDMPMVFRSTLNFLGVDPGFSTVFERVNEAKKIRFKSLRLVHKNLPVHALEWIPGPILSVLSRFYVRLNYVNMKRTPLRSELRARLVEEFRPDIDRLGTLIDRDLSHWHHEAHPDEARRRREGRVRTP